MPFMIAALCSALLLVSIADGAQAQIVNTLRGFDADTLGWSGEIEAAFSRVGGNTEVLTLSGGAQIQWQSERQRTRLLGRTVRGESDGTTTREASMAHLRHNYRLRTWLNSLAFAQIQNDLFQRLKRRLLFGAGARFDVFRRNSGTLALGAAHMLEIEKIRGVAGTDEDHRLSTFISWTGQIQSHAEIDLSGFYQPLWTDFADARAVLNASLSIPLVHRLSLELKGGYAYDSEPPPSVEKEDWSHTTGFRLEL